MKLLGLVNVQENLIEFTNGIHIPSEKLTFIIEFPLTQGKPKRKSRAISISIKTVEKQGQYFENFNFCVCVCACALEEAVM